MYLGEELQTKWAPVLNHPDLPALTDAHKRACIAILLENTQVGLSEVSAQSPGSQFLTETQGLSVDAVPVNATGSGISNFDPILISLIRRAMPNLIAYDICGVQPMTGPTGLVFAMRSRYTSQTGPENFYNEVDDTFSTITASNTTLGQANTGLLGTGPFPGSNLSGNSIYGTGSGMATATAENLGTSGGTAFAEMAFSIEKVTVTAKSRALKAQYTMEMAQDLKAIHGLDAENELSSILQSEILAEINREIIRTINITAQPGANTGTASAGIFDLDVDSNGRWSVEKFKGLMFQLQRECNQIAKSTRRGKGNIMLCSSDVASALEMAGVLSYSPNLATQLQVDDTGNTFAGMVNGRIKVYIDPYVSGGDYVTVGYKGPSFTDAGLFYCPYIPLQMVRAVDPDSFVPKIGFKSRYGIVSNPYAQGATTTNPGALLQDSNVYYRRIQVKNLL
jgi:Major capsid protein Gp23